MRQEPESSSPAWVTQSTEGGRSRQGWKRGCDLVFVLFPSFFSYLLPHGSGSSGFLALVLLPKPAELHISALPAGGPLPGVSQGWILITQLPSDVVPHAARPSSVVMENSTCLLGQ